VAVRAYAVFDGCFVTFLDAGSVVKQGELVNSRCNTLATRDGRNTALQGPSGDNEKEIAMKKNGMTLLGSLLSLALLFTFAYGQDSKAAKAESDTAEGPQVGQPAPDFEVPWADQAGIHTAKNEWVKLSSLRGSNVILAFYVADWTGG
jgi:hypothetical protein